MSPNRWFSDRLNLFQAPSSIPFNRYDQWRQVFVAHRLRLAFLLAIVYFSGWTSILGIEAWRSGWVPHSIIVVRFWKHVIALMLLVVGHFGLRTSRGKANPNLALILLGWIACIVTNYPNQLDQPIPPDLTGWNLMFFATAAIVPFYWRSHLILHSGSYAYHFLINALLQQSPFAEVDASKLLFDMVWMSGLSALVAYLYERLSQQQFLTQQNLLREQKRSQRLLINVLPAKIAARLIKRPGIIADRHSEVTVLFADLVDFTEIASKVTPSEVMTLLNKIFSEFDELVKHHGVEKIKTIGDAYMAVAGVPEPRDDHGPAIANLALDMQRTISDLNSQYSHPLKLRVGIHTGPVIAGVLGLQKFSYDLWGDTVNTASRMESYGCPNHIQISEETYGLLQHSYRCETRGIIDIKGKGQVKTYWLWDRFS